jgi:hypothetical protein
LAHLLLLHRLLLLLRVPLQLHTLAASLAAPPTNTAHLPTLASTQRSYHRLLLLLLLALVPLLLLVHQQHRQSIQGTAVAQGRYCWALRGRCLLLLLLLGQVHHRCVGPAVR